MAREPKKDKWKLSWDDVSCGMHGSSSGKTGQFERKLKVTSSTVYLIHKTTGTRVEGIIPPGHYSKKEMQKLRQKLAEQLFEELQNQLAKKLGISGR